MLWIQNNFNMLRDLKTDTFLIQRYDRALTSSHGYLKSEPPQYVPEAMK